MASRAWSCKSSRTSSAMLHAYVRPHGLCACLSAWPGQPPRPTSNCCHWTTSFSKMAARNGTPALSEIGGLPHDWKQEASKAGFIRGVCPWPPIWFTNSLRLYDSNLMGLTVRNTTAAGFYWQHWFPLCPTLRRRPVTGHLFFARQGFPPQLSRDKVGKKTL